MSSMDQNIENLVESAVDNLNKVSEQVTNDSSEQITKLVSETLDTVVNENLEHIPNVVTELTRAERNAEFLKKEVVWMFDPNNIYSLSSTVRRISYDLGKWITINIAKIFRYPDIPGMPRENPFWTRRNEMIANLARRLPVHKGTMLKPYTRARSWVEVFFGETPKLELISRHNFINKTDGYYNFYFIHYSNIKFLPNCVSETIQILFNQCLDITAIEIVRECLFLSLLVFCEILSLRLLIYWYPVLNPYQIPFVFLVSITDWLEEPSSGIFPSPLGINITTTVILGLLGSAADQFNHVVFTMPYLPSEGKAMRILVKKKTLTDVIVYKGLPKLWREYPIPDKIRRFWFYKRPDILNFMRRKYKDENIIFLPNEAIREIKAKNELFKNQIDDFINNNIQFSIIKPQKDHFHQMKEILVNDFVKQNPIVINDNEWLNFEEFLDLKEKEIINKHTLELKIWFQPYQEQLLQTRSKEVLALRAKKLKEFVTLKDDEIFQKNLIDINQTFKTEEMQEELTRLLKKQTYELDDAIKQHIKIIKQLIEQGHESMKPEIIDQNQIHLSNYTHYFSDILKTEILSKHDHFHFSNVITYLKSFNHLFDL